MPARSATAPGSIWATPGMLPLALVALTGFSGYAALLPVAPLWAVHGGADTAGAGLVNFVLLGATVATQFAVPWLIRRIGWGHALTLGMVLMGVPALIHGLSDALGAILALSAVRGFGFAILTVAGSAGAVLLVPPGRRGASVGVYSAALSIPNVLLMPAGAWAADVWGFGPVFAVSALPLLGIPACYAVGRHLPERATHDASHPAAPDGVPESRRAVALAIASPAVILLAITLAGGAVISFAPQFVTHGWLAGLGLFALGLATALTRALVGGVADRVGARRLLWPFVVIAVVALGWIALLAATPIDAPAAGWWLAACAVLGTAYGGLQSLTMLRSFESAGPRNVGAASAVWNAGFDAGTATGSVLVGAIAVGAGFGVGLGVTAALCLATLPLALAQRR